MKLSILLQSIEKTLKKDDVEITFITDDSRKCKPGSVFVCRDSAKEFVSDALKNGAAAVVCESELCEGCYVVENASQAYSTLCRCFFGYPDRQLSIIAVTGTNGKTTVASMLSFILEMNGKKCGLLSTVVNRASEELPSDMTTPDSFELNRMLYQMVQIGNEYCVMEASSQGLAEERLFGIRFKAAVFTNLTQDHLDYHKTFENYKNAKKKLFSCCETAVINYDDEHSEEFIDCCSGKVFTYSVKHNEADFSAKSIRYFPDGLDYVLVANSLIHRVRLNLQGDFNVENSMAAIICAMSLGLSVEDCASSLRTFSAVKGRLELVETNTPFKVFIDYAHTPDSLRRVLMSLRRMCSGKLILVFGCGGDRDRQKRSRMGRIAVSLADTVIVTSDNPRTESSMAIIDDILSETAGIKTPVFVQENRKKAIAFALAKAKKGDMVLLAGKGHEEYQIIGREKIPFDERQIIDSILKEKH